MFRRCRICGKALYKTSGNIGPRCLKKLRYQTKGKRFKKDLFDQGLFNEDLLDEKGRIRKTNSEFEE